MKDISNELLAIMELYKCNELLAFLILKRSESEPYELEILQPEPEI